MEAPAAAAGTSPSRSTSFTVPDEVLHDDARFAVVVWARGPGGFSGTALAPFLFRPARDNPLLEYDPVRPEGLAPDGGEEVPAGAPLELTWRIRQPLASQAGFRVEVLEDAFLADDVTPVYDVEVSGPPARVCRTVVPGEVLRAGHVYSWYITVRSADRRTAFAPSEGVFRAGGCAAPHQRKDDHMAHVSTRAMDLHTAAPFGISRWTHSEFARFVVELRQGGLIGLGEGAPNARYGESREQDMDLLTDWAPEIADLEGPAGVEMYCEGLGGAGVPALRAGLSAAAWDLAGKQAGEPVWRMLGLARPSVRTSYTIAIGAPEEMLAQARAASAFGTLKVKLGFDGDLELARRLKLELPDVTFRYDANEGWDRERAATALAVLEDLDAELVEQPLPASDPEGMVWLKERTRIPLLADEAVLSHRRPRRRGRGLRRRRGQAGEGGGHRRRLRPHLGVHRARPARADRLHGRVEPRHRRRAAARRPRRLRGPGRGAAAGGGPVHGHRRGRRPADGV